jgi:hypothetical protein
MINDDYLAMINHDWPVYFAPIWKFGHFVIVSPILCLQELGAGCASPKNSRIILW